MIPVIGYLGGIIAVAATSWRLWLLRNGSRSREFLIFWVTSCGVAVAAVLLAPTTGFREFGTGGVDLSTLLGVGLRQGAAGAVAIFAVVLNGGGRKPLVVQLRWLALVETLLVATFSLAGLHHVADGAALTGERGWVIAYDVLRLTYPLWCLGYFFCAMLPYARRLPRGPARLGSQLLANAAVVGILWTSWTVDDIFTTLTSGRQDAGDDLPSVALEITLILLVAAGSTASAWARLGVSPAQWWRDLRHYRAMGPLWHSLCNGSEAAGERRVIDRLAVRPWRASTSCYRRVIEIRDGQLALNGFFGHAGAPSSATTADGEAAAIAAALVARTAAAPAAFPAAATAPAATAPAAADADADGRQSWFSGEFSSVDSEAAWLANVSRAFAGSRSPLASV